MILTDRLGDIFDKVIFYGLSFLVVFTPFATVSTMPLSFDMPWSLAVTALIVLFLVALWLIRDVCQGTLKFASTPLNLPLIAFVTLVLFQLLPLPPKILQFISPSSVSAYRMTEMKILKIFLKYSGLIIRTPTNKTSNLFIFYLLSFPFRWETKKMRNKKKVLTPLNLH